MKSSYGWDKVESKLNVIRCHHDSVMAEIISIPNKFLATIYFDEPKLNSFYATLFNGSYSRMSDAKRAVRRKLEVIAEEFRLAALWIR